MQEHNERKYFHLAGIVPVSGQQLDFKMPWHDAMMPIAQNYLAVERAVVECAYAGCETIWIVCHDDIQPLIRYRLGDKVNDPIWEYRYKDPEPYKSKKSIPIFYVPIPVKDKDKRDCLSWSVLYGAIAACKVSGGISKWLMPGRCYVAFPYGIYEPKILQPHRKKISSKNGFFLSHQGKTIKDGEYLGFTFKTADIKKFTKNFRRKATTKWVKPLPKDGKMKTLPIDERYSGRFFSLEDVFDIIELDKDKDTFFEVPWHFSVDNWEDYCYYISSSERKDIWRPSKRILHYAEWNKIGEPYDDESGDI